VAKFALGRVAFGRFGVLIALFGSGLMLVGFALPPATAATSSSVPSGKSNNGDMKVQDVGDSDFPPENDPHVDCPFDVVFYNFDAGQHLSATLYAQPPSGHDSDRVFGPTAVVVDTHGFARMHVHARDLELAGLSSHPEAGANDLDDRHSADRDRDEATFHLKLDVQTIAGDHLFKHKVFWVGECAPTPATTTTTSTSTSTSVTISPTTTVPQTSTSTTSTSTSTSTTTLTVSPESTIATTSTTTTPVTSSGSTVPVTTSPPSTISPTTTTRLPFTGTNATIIGWFGLAVTTTGLTLVATARRRTYRR
jgi:hypothetical protein